MLLKIMYSDAISNKISSTNAIYIAAFRNNRIGARCSTPQKLLLKMLFWKCSKWNKEVEVNIVLTYEYIDHELILLKCE